MSFPAMHNLCNSLCHFHTPSAIIFAHLPRARGAARRQRQVSEPNTHTTLEALTIPTEAPSRHGALTAPMEPIPEHTPSRQLPLTPTVIRKHKHLRRVSTHHKLPPPVRHTYIKLPNPLLLPSRATSLHHHKIHSPCAHISTTTTTTTPFTIQSTRIPLLCFFYPTKRTTDPPLKFLRYYPCPIA